MNFKNFSICVCLAVLAAGCATAPQQPVSVNRTAIAPGTGKIGIVMTPLPKVNTYFPGANCLLCIAAAEAANSALTKYTQTLPYEGLDKLSDALAQILKSKGVEVQVIGEPLNAQKLPAFDAAKGVNAPRKNFQSLRAKFNVDRLLVIDLNAIGFIRTYSAYFPTSDPKAYISGSGYIVDLSTNNYDWYSPVNIQLSADGAWDEAPQFPSLTNAYFQAIEKTKDQIQEVFRK